MDRELAQPLAFELPAAPAADMRIHFERLLPVFPFPSRAIAPRIRDDVVL
jgi:hypothetical protein